MARVKYFGDPWPSGICEEGEQVKTPIGIPCYWCEEAVERGDQGSFMGSQSGPLPVHRECAFRISMGGIGHFENHLYWCVEMHDPDGGRTARQSALAVWEWAQTHSMP